MGNDLAVVRSALAKSADRYEEVLGDQRTFGGFTDRVDAASQPAGDSTQNATKALQTKGQVLGALHQLNRDGEETIRRLATSLRETADLYQHREDENVEVIREAQAKWGGYGNTDKQAKPRVGPPQQESNEHRTDWSTGNASAFGQFGKELPEGWGDVDLDMAVTNLDFTYGMKVPDWLAIAIEWVLHFNDNFASLQRCADSWLPVDSLGKGVKREGAAYMQVARDLWHDIEVMETNWHGDAAESARRVMVKCSQWFLTVGVRANDVGEDIHEQAESSYACQKQLYYLIEEIIAAIPGLNVLVSGIQIVVACVMGVISMATGDWTKLWACIGQLVLQIVGLFKDCVGWVIAIWGAVQYVWQVLRHAATTGQHTLAAEPPVWG